MPVVRRLFNIFLLCQVLEKTLVVLFHWWIPIHTKVSSMKAWGLVAMETVFNILVTIVLFQIHTNYHSA